MSDYKVNFREMKSRVGIDDIAYALGYRLDRKAGVGRYIELVLGEGGNKRDTLIVSHPNDKAVQTFFRRDGSKGDVVTLIRENLSSFTVSGKDEWQKIAKVMARFANMPEPEYREDREYVKSAGKSSGVFDASRYEVKPVDTGKIPGLFFRRGLSKATVTALSPFISLIRDRNNGKFEGYNIDSHILTEREMKSGGMKSEDMAVTSRRLPVRIRHLRHGWLFLRVSVRTMLEACSSVNRLLMPWPSTR